MPAVVSTEKLETAASAFERSRDLQKQRKLEAAAAYFQEAIAFDRNYIPAYNNLGNLLQLQGKIPEAIALLQRAIEINPNLAATRCNLASAYLLQGNIAAASFVDIDNDGDLDAFVGVMKATTATTRIPAPPTLQPLLLR